MICVMALDCPDVPNKKATECVLNGDFALYDVQFAE